VRGIDLDVPQGEFFGLLGPNGAGKSTTIGMPTTLVYPTGGRAWAAGHDVTRDTVAVKRRIGVVTQNNTPDRRHPGLRRPRRPPGGNGSLAVAGIPLRGQVLLPCGY
jgi:ABC-type Mn2+/Zn2+ transport system ATPase subunit